MFLVSTRVTVTVISGDPDGDGQYTSSGNGDFERVSCGCPGYDVFYQQTPSPVGSGDVQWTPSPVATTPDAATPPPAPVSRQTLAPVATDSVSRSHVMMG